MGHKIAQFWLVGVILFGYLGCTGVVLRENDWLPIASTVRVRLASQTSILADAPPVDVEFPARVISVENRGDEGVHIRLETTSGRQDTLVLAVPDPSIVTLKADEKIKVRFASANFGRLDRRAGLTIKTPNDELLLMIQDSGLPADIKPPHPLKVSTGQRVTYTVATRDADYCYRVVEHRAFRIFTGLTERTIAPGDAPFDYRSGTTNYRFIPVEHRVEARSSSCATALTPRVIWMAYAVSRSSKSTSGDENPVERTAPVP